MNLTTLIQKKETLFNNKKFTSLPTKRSYDMSEPIQPTITDLTPGTKLPTICNRAITKKLMELAVTGSCAIQLATYPNGQQKVLIKFRHDSQDDVGGAYKIILPTEGYNVMAIVIVGPRLADKLTFDDSLKPVNESNYTVLTVCRPAKRTASAINDVFIAANLIRFHFSNIYDRVQMVTNKTRAICNMFK